MQHRFFPLLGVAIMCALASPGRPSAAPLSVLAAENVYGDVAHQLAGPHATVASVLSSPDQDPHLFEASPSVAREMAMARIVVINGAAYDPWAARLLAATPSSNRTTIVVADLVGKTAGDNPHLWYHPATMPALARALSGDLAAADPADAADFGERLTRFLESLEPLRERIAAMRSRYSGTPVTATEPVFGYMASALGLKMRNEAFQRAVMNGTEPGASDIAAFEADLRQRRVRLLLFNSQATDPAAQRLLGIAKASGVPVVGVTETEPAGKTYQAWMLDQLDAVQRALSEPSSR